VYTPVRRRKPAMMRAEHAIDGFPSRSAKEVLLRRRPSIGPFVERFVEPFDRDQGAPSRLLLVERLGPEGEDRVLSIGALRAA
jgi:hypothetical protein